MWTTERPDKLYLSGNIVDLVDGYHLTPHVYYLVIFDSTIQLEQQCIIDLRGGLWATERSDRLYLSGNIIDLVDDYHLTSYAYDFFILDPMI